ncbi:metal-sensing transcriptional repressor [Streptomyces sp. NPDC007095]|uniref:metal-sensing transcriptional repressor n=1 Tax=Streptomyces sp. NPDC007095 TaxID=3154482 RepID=UPI000C7138E3
MSPCIDVLTQFTAASRAVQEVAPGFLDDHVRGCVHQRGAPTRPTPKRSSQKWPTPCAAHCVCSHRCGVSHRRRSSRPLTPTGYADSEESFHIEHGRKS